MATRTRPIVTSVTRKPRESTASTASLAAGIDYKGTGSIPIDIRKLPTDTTGSGTGQGSPTLGTDSAGNPVAIGQGVETVGTAGASPSDIFRAWGRTGAEVGGSGGGTVGDRQSAARSRSGMADALRIGQNTRTASTRDVKRKKQRNTLGLNIANQGIGLQV